MATQQTIDALKKHEEVLIFDRFDEDLAWRLGVMLRELGLASRAPIIIDIRQGARILFFCSLPGSTPDNLEWARRKRNVVDRYHCSTYSMGQKLALKGDTMENRYGLPIADYAAHGGGFPVRTHSAGVIGSIVVSGLPQQEDHMLIVKALCEVLGKDFASMALPAV